MGLAIARTRAITRWNLLALLVMLLGVVVTLGLDRVSLHQWAASGLRIPVGEHFEVSLPDGDTLVYYESAQNIVPDRIQLDIVGADGVRMRARRPMDENNFRLRLTGSSGRSLWTIRLEEPGTYRIRGFNADYLDDAAVPVDDRIVLFKEPRTLAAAIANRKLIQITGASITMSMALVFYLVHWRVLSIRGRDQAPESPRTSDVAMPLDASFAGEPGGAP